jgi:hypothetical protein
LIKPKGVYSPDRRGEAVDGDGATEAAAWFQRPKFSRRTKELPNELPNDLRLIEVNVRDDGIYLSLTEGSAMNHYP